MPDHSTSVFLERMRVGVLGLWFEAQAVDRQMEAARRVGVIAHADALHLAGFSRCLADTAAGYAAGVAPRTIDKWRRRVRGVRLDRAEALYLLCPRTMRTRSKRKGRRA